MKITKDFNDFKLMPDSKEKSVAISLGNSKELLDALRTYAWKLVSLSMRSKSKTLNRTRLFYNFGRYLLVLYHRHGSLYVVKYLKSSQLALQKVVAGQPFSSLREIEPELPLPRLARCGLPAFIGPMDRRAILSNSKTVIRLYLTLLGLYRVISAPVSQKLATITDSFSGDPVFLNVASTWFSVNGKARLGSIQIDNLQVKKFKFRSTASPSNSHS
jgi:hypothetical protein